MESTEEEEGDGSERLKVSSAIEQWKSFMSEPESSKWLIDFIDNFRTG